MDYKITVLPGDGIGPDVIDQGVKVIVRIGQKYGHDFDLRYDEIGGIAIDKYGVALRPESVEKAGRSDAVLMGAVGGPKWDDPQAKVHPEDGLLQIRKGLGVFANIRPVKVFPQLTDSSVLKRHVLENVDIVVVRELTGGLYYGLPKRRRKTKHGWTSVDTMRYSQQEIERVLRVGFELAKKRRKKLASIDKANVLETSRLWRQVANELASQYQDVHVEHMLVDNCAMQLIQNPSRFDVIVAENTFGDILTDEAAVLSASMGLLPSASLAGIPLEGKRTVGLYEPIHGSAPDIAGKGIANPLATILTVALMMRYSLGLIEEAARIERAVCSALEDGYRTPDIATGDGSEAKITVVGTSDMGTRVVEAI